MFIRVDNDNNVVCVGNDLNKGTRTKIVDYIPIDIDTCNYKYSLGRYINLGTKVAEAKSNAELEKENDRLKLQIQALNEQQEFIEDCLIEMAMVVYE